jgi:acyl-ACP thioesterase
MLSCNRYRIIRNVFLKNYTLPTNLIEYLKFFVNMDKEKKLYVTTSNVLLRLGTDFEPHFYYKHTRM